jgi:hypothetical protein
MKRYQPKRRAGGLCLLVCLLAVLCGGASAGLAADFAAIEPANTDEGYLARLLINETPFPGEHGYQSTDDTKAAMLSILWVLHSRIDNVPPGYTQKQLANSSSDNIIDLITAPMQCEGFSMGANGKPTMAPRVEERLNYLKKIANSGGKPGKFAGLLNFGQGLASAYLENGIPGADRFAGLETVNRITVTGRAYSWMTDQNIYNPGGNFVTIPDSDSGSLGGNRFFTLRKDPK